MNKGWRLSGAVFVAIPLASCGKGGGEPANVVVEPVVVPPIENPPVALSRLTRSELLEAVATAASAYAAGRDDRTAQDALKGRPFDLAIRFGCDGPGAADEPLRWSVDESGAKLEVSAAPVLRLDPSQVAGAARVEAIEGFWVPRPWQVEEGCPRPEAPVDVQPPAEGSAESPGFAAVLPAPAPSPTPAVTKIVAPQDKSVGIAQYFGLDESRVTRRAGRPYSTTERLDPGAVPRKGIRLRFGGRLRAWPDGRVIRCTGPSGERPSCILSVDIDQVEFERPENGDVIATWSK